MTARPAILLLVGALAGCAATDPRPQLIADAQQDIAYSNRIYDELEDECRILADPANNRGRMPTPGFVAKCTDDLAAALHWPTRAMYEKLTPGRLALAEAGIPPGPKRSTSRIDIAGHVRMRQAEARASRAEASARVFQGQVLRALRKLD